VCHFYFHCLHHDDYDDDDSDDDENDDDDPHFYYFPSNCYFSGLTGCLINYSDIHPWVQLISGSSVY
jgi:hypothetical protein